MPYKHVRDRRRYAREHYLRNAAAYKKAAKAHKAKTRIVVRSFLEEYLANHPCVDCGEEDPVVLEFDHRVAGDKRFNLGDAARGSFSLASAETEVGKCDVRCANCHRRKTYYERLYH